MRHHPSLVEQLGALSPEALAKVRQTVAARRPSGHALLAEALKSCGIQRVYGIGGTPVDGTFTECAARSIRPISAATQEASVLMAAADNYVSGSLQGAVLVSAGPAVANTLGGILTARENSWPLLLLGGRRPLYREGMGYFQELDAAPIFTSVTKRSTTVRSAAEIRDQVFQAASIACSGPRGPVYLDLPEDVLDGHSSDGGCKALPSRERKPLDSDAVERAARLVASAERPLLVIGEEIRWSFSAASLHRLVEDFGIPFISSPMGRGFLPDAHPLCGNALRRSLLNQADRIIMAGAWFDWRFRFGSELSPDVQVVHATLHQETLGKNVPLAVGIVGEPGEFLAQLAEALGTAADGPSPGRSAGWREHLRRAPVRSQSAAGDDPPGRPMQPQQLYSILQEALPEDALVAVEGNVSLAAAQQCLRINRPASYLDPGRSGVIGASIPFAMGAKLACPDRPTFALCGDTGFAMSSLNLEAAVRHRIPIVVVIANNDGNCGALRQRACFPANYPEKFAEFQPGLRWERVVECLGGHAEFVTEPGQIGPALARALGSGLPACLNVRIDPEAAHPGPW